MALFNNAYQFPHQSPIHESYKPNGFHFNYQNSSLLNGIQLNPAINPVAYHSSNMISSPMRMQTQTQTDSKYICANITPLQVKNVLPNQYQQVIETYELETYIKQQIDSAHWQSFLNRQDWTMQSEGQFIRNKYSEITQNGLFPSLQNFAIWTAIHSTVLENPHNFTTSQTGDLYRSNKMLGDKLNQNRRLDYSIVRASDGKLYELLYRPSVEVQQEIKTKLGFKITDPTGRFNKGGAGSIKFARDLETREILIAKTVKDAVMGSFEWNAMHNIKPGPYLFTHQSGAVVSRINKKGVTENKFYFFGPYAEKGDGVKHINKVIKPLKISDMHQAQTAMGETALIYTGAAVSLHSQNMGHRDIKLANFFHSNLLGTRLADFGVAASLNDETHQSGSGTSRYFPPEMDTDRYNYVAHDSWSLGIVMLEIKFGRYVPLPKDVHLNIGGYDISLEFNELKRCTGIPADHPIYNNIKYETYDEIAAGYLNQDPNKRLTPAQAENTPYFLQVSLARTIALYSGSQKDLLV